MPSKDKDFIQAHWKPLALASLIAPALIAIVFLQSSYLLLVYAISSVWTAWNIHAYAAGKRFHVSAGIWAEDSDGRSRRRNILAISILAELFFTGFVIYSFYRSAA